MKRVRAGGAVVVIAASSAIACNALSGIGDLQAGALDDDGGAFVGDARSTSEAGTDASSSSGSLTCNGVGGSCVPLPPAGWDGPFLVYDKSNLPPGGTACPAALPKTFELGVGAPTRTFECPACKCVGPTGGLCTSTFTMYGDTTCADTTTLISTTDATACQSNATGASVGAKFRQSVSAVGSCTAALNGAPKIGAVSWTTSYVFCGSDSLNAIGCSSQDERCLPPAAGAKRCIISDKNMACPDPWKSATPVFADVADNRACDPTSCHCADPTGVTCGGAVYKTFGNATCATGILPPFGTARAVDTCFALDPNLSGKAATPPSAQGGTCAVSGSPTLTGTLAPGAAATTCCLP